MKPEVISTIYAETIARRQLPVNFNQEDLELFKGERERVIPATRLLKFHDVLASPEGLLFAGTQILRESFAFPHHRDQWKRRSVVKFLVKNYGLRRRRRIDEALWITDYWSTGHFHWLTDVLTRLFAGRDRSTRLLLPGIYQSLDVVKSSLAAFGVKNVDFIERNEVVVCGSLLAPSHTAPSGHFNEEAIRGVRNVLLSAYGSTGKLNDRGEERLYITRAKAAKRRIANEAEILPVLNSFGFQTIYAEDLSFEQQVRTFSRARYLVSNHGAGLTNILFMRDGGRVLELRHQTDRINNCYFTLSSALDFDYFYQTCRPQNSAADPHEADLVVDVDQLKANLTLLPG